MKTLLTIFFLLLAAVNSSIAAGEVKLVALGIYEAIPKPSSYDGTNIVFAPKDGYQYWIRTNVVKSNRYAYNKLLYKILYDGKATNIIVVTYTHRYVIDLATEQWFQTPQGQEFIVTNKYKLDPKDSNGYYINETVSKVISIEQLKTSSPATYIIHSYYDYCPFTFVDIKLIQEN